MTWHGQQRDVPGGYLLLVNCEHPFQPWWSRCMTGVDVCMMYVWCCMLTYSWHLLIQLSIAKPKVKVDKIHCNTAESSQKSICVSNMRRHSIVVFQWNIVWRYNTILLNVITMLNVQIPHFLVQQFWEKVEWTKTRERKIARRRHFCPNLVFSDTS